MKKRNKEDIINSNGIAALSDAQYSGKECTGNAFFHALVGEQISLSNHDDEFHYNNYLSIRKIKI
jgi:hypothetical protein